MGVDTGIAGVPAAEGGAMPVADRLRLVVAGIDPGAAGMARRGFRITPAAPRLERIGRSFVAGYGCALAGRPCAAAAAAAGQEAGFVWEGAAMGAAVRDGLSMAGRAHAVLLREAAARQPFLAAVGTGWAMARMRWRRRALVRALPPLLVPLALDGWGFHDVYFRPAALARGAPRALRRNFGKQGAAHWDQGAGRALWFVAGAGTDAVRHMLEGADPARRADLASGAGLAACYAGGAGPEALRALARRMPHAAAHLAQGAAFGFEARARAGLRSAEHDAAATALTGLDPAALSARVAQALHGTVESPDRSLKAGMARYRAWCAVLADTFRTEGPIA